MYHTRIKKILFCVIALLMLSLLTSGCLLLRFLPDNTVGVGLFKAVYSISLTRKNFLEFYSPVRKDAIRYVPVDVNQFLIQKIENTTDENEISAIVHFYSLQAKEHRIGYLINISESARIKVINQLIKGLDDEANLGGKLMLLEETRTDKRLGKGSVGIIGTNYLTFPTQQEYRKWFYEQSVSVVLAKYQEWWNSNLSWEEKKKINPLKNTNVGVSHCCG